MYVKKIRQFLSSIKKMHTKEYRFLFSAPRCSEQRFFHDPAERLSQYQKDKTNLDFTEARDSEWQWHQLGRMQVCTSLQTGYHASDPPVSFYRPDALHAAQPTASKLPTVLPIVNLVNKDFSINWRCDVVSYRTGSREGAAESRTLPANDRGRGGDVTEVTTGH